MNISQEMNSTIQQELERIEREEGVLILYACESGEGLGLSVDRQRL